MKALIALSLLAGGAAAVFAQGGPPLRPEPWKPAPPRTSRLLVTDIPRDKRPLRERLIAEILRLAKLGDTVLPYDWVKANLDNEWMDQWVSLSISNLTRHPAYHGASSLMTEAERRSQIPVQARVLLRRLELVFITQGGFSTIDLLPEPSRSHFRKFEWDADDYPGGPVGPHEDEALALDAALARIRPERRANSTAAAVVTEAQFNDDVWKYIEAEERPVPGQEERKLNRWALASFLTMREAAKRDGVDIVILSSNRLPSTAAANAARTNNAFAVARFSSHILGLAMDIRMSNGDQKYEEATTRPMSNIIAMRASRAHKWMFVHGAAYGWYPYTHEPWHWEYNPPGFRERFWKGYTGK